MTVRPKPNPICSCLSEVSRSFGVCAYRLVSSLKPRSWKESAEDWTLLAGVAGGGLLAGAGLISGALPAGLALAYMTSRFSQDKIEEIVTYKKIFDRGKKTLKAVKKLPKIPKPVPLVAAAPVKPSSPVSAVSSIAFPRIERPQGSFVVNYGKEGFRENGKRPSVFLLSPNDANPQETYECVGLKSRSGMSVAATRKEEGARHVFQQSGETAEEACREMLALDGRPILIWEDFERGGGVTREAAKEALKNGPLLVRFEHPTLGAHCLIADEYDEARDYIIFRDPHHGLSLVASRETFAEVAKKRDALPSTPARPAASENAAAAKFKEAASRSALPNLSAPPASGPPADTKEQIEGASAKTSHRPPIKRGKAATAAAVSARPRACQALPPGAPPGVTNGGNTCFFTSGVLQAIFLNCSSSWIPRIQSALERRRSDPGIEEMLEQIIKIGEHPELPGLIALQQAMVQRRSQAEILAALKALPLNEVDYFVFNQKAAALSALLEQELSVKTKLDKLVRKGVHPELPKLVALQKAIADNRTHSEILTILESIPLEGSSKFIKEAKELLRLLKKNLNFQESLAQIIAKGNHPKQAQLVALHQAMESREWFRIFKALTSFPFDETGNENLDTKAKELLSLLEFSHLILHCKRCETNREIIPWKISRSIRWILGRLSPDFSSGQHDAHEAYGLLCNLISDGEDDPAALIQTSINLVKNHEVNQQREPSFIDMHVMPEHTVLQHIQSHFNEKVDEQTHTITRKFRSAPPILVLGFKRYAHPGGKSHSFDKISKSIKAEKRFRLNGALVEGPGADYELAGVVSHKGSHPASGHYTGHVAWHLPESQDPSHYACDDVSADLVTPCQETDLLKSAKTAYMLVYKRV